jgi:hypothetical protein
VDLKQYGINKTPSLVVFENIKPIKIIYWEENIQKLVKSLNLNINKTIESL